MFARFSGKVSSRWACISREVAGKVIVIHRFTDSQKFSAGKDLVMTALYFFIGNFSFISHMF